MRTLALTLLPAMALAVPADLAAIKADVDGRIQYVYEKGWDLIYLPKGGKGNCAVFATNYWMDANRAGRKGMVRGCKLADGQEHAFLVVDDEWVLDNRMQTVVRKGENGCE
jgi:hypothetical protein